MQANKEEVLRFARYPMAKVPGTYTTPPWEREDITAQQLDKELEHVKKAWTDNNVDPANLGFDMIPVIEGFNVLVKYLVEKGVVDKEEIDVLYKKQLLHAYTVQFKRLMQLIHGQQEERKLIAVPDKRIVGPNGEILGGS